MSSGEDNGGPAKQIFLSRMGNNPLRNGPSVEDKLRILYTHTVPTINNIVDGRIVHGDILIDPIRTAESRRRAIRSLKSSGIPNGYSVKFNDSSGRAVLYSGDKPYVPGY